jgi:hypothetical protein
VRAWISLCLFPLGLLVGIALVSLGSVIGSLLALAWTFVLVPHVGKYILTHSRGRSDGGDEDGFPDVTTHYWRTTLR